MWLNICIHLLMTWNAPWLEARLLQTFFFICVCLYLYIIQYGEWQRLSKVHHCDILPSEKCWLVSWVSPMHLCIWSGRRHSIIVVDVHAFVVLMWQSIQYNHTVIWSRKISSCLRKSWNTTPGTLSSCKV